MKAFLRSWRSLVLAWAVLLAPQASLLHALSHDTAGRSAHQEESDKRNHGAAKVCATCLAFAQLGASLPSRFEPVDRSLAPPLLAGAAVVAAVSRHVIAFDARAPPALLT